MKTAVNKSRAPTKTSQKCINEMRQELIMEMKVLIRSKRCNGFYCHKYLYLHVSRSEQKRPCHCGARAEQTQSEAALPLAHSLARSLYNFMAIKRSS